MFGRSAYRVHAIERKVAQATGRERPRRRPTLVGICGGSGSGKSSFCSDLALHVGSDKLLVVSESDYFRDFSTLPVDERARMNFDHPEALEMDMLANHLEDLRSGLGIVSPRYDFVQHRRKGVDLFLEPKPIVLVEGRCILFDKKISSLLDLKVFLDLPEPDRRHRRLQRDLTELGRSPEFAEWQIASFVLPMHDRFVASSRLEAHEIAESLESRDAIFHHLKHLFQKTKVESD